MYEKFPRDFLLKGIDIFYSHESYLSHWARSFQNSGDVPAKNFAELYGLAFVDSQSTLQMNTPDNLSPRLSGSS